MIMNPGASSSRVKDALPWVFTLSLLLKLVCSLWLFQSTPPAPASTSVLLAFDNSRHFSLATPQGLAEQSAIIPSNGGIISHPSNNETYTISMFHQLGCLSVISNDITRDVIAQPEPSRLARHCLNYLRQMIECRGDVNLEGFQSTNSHVPVDLYRNYVCKDWGKVYEWVGMDDPLNQKL